MQEDHRLVVADTETFPVDDDLVGGLVNGQGRTGSVNRAGTGGDGSSLRQGVGQGRKPADQVHQKSYQESIDRTRRICKS